MLEIDDELKEYVTNYRMNLYDCHEHDIFEEYKTGLRQVFETVRYAKNKEKLKEVMEENREAYSRIDSDTRNMLEVVANIKIPVECRVLADGKERYDMCKAFEDMRQEGYDEGMEKGMEKGKKKGKKKGIKKGMKKGTEKGIRILIQAYRELGIPQDVITEKCAEKYAMTREDAGKYVKESAICKIS